MAAFKISLQLADFTSSNVYLEGEDKSIDAVKAWLGGRGSTGTAIPWAGIFEAVSSTSSQSSTGLLLKIARALVQLLKSSEEVLRFDESTAAVLAPDIEAAATAALKLSFFFLCHLTKATTTSWPIRKECSQALAAAEIRVSLVEAADKRAAELLLLTTMLEVLVAASSSPGSDVSLKPIAAATKKTVIDFLAQVLCQATASARALKALLSLVEQPKQKDSVLKDVASVFLCAWQHSEVTGCSIIAATLDRAGKNNTSSSDNLACILLTLASSRDAIGAQLRASLMAQPKEVSLLLQHLRPAVKKLALDIAAILRFKEVFPTVAMKECWSQIVFAAVLIVLHDFDANLRGKALSILENYAEGIVVAADNTVNGRKFMESIVSSLGDCLIDRSIAVRKKAVLATAAIASAATSHLPSTEALLLTLQARAMPNVCSLLQLPRDNKLYPGETAAATLCTTFIALARPAHLPAGALSMLSLHRTTPDETVRLQLQTAFAEACLSGSSSSETTMLEALLSECITQQEVAELRSTLHLATDGNRTFAARMQAELSRVAENISNLITHYNEGRMERLAKMIYVLGPPPAAVASRPGGSGGKAATEEECVWLLNLTQSIVRKRNGFDYYCHALRWTLLSLKLWMEQLEADSKAKLESGIVALVISVAACQCSDAMKSSLSLVHLLPNAREMFNVLLNYFSPSAKEKSTSFATPFPVDENNASACVAFLSTSTAMAELYRLDKADFCSYLDQQQDQRSLEGLEEENVAGSTAAAFKDDAEVTDFCLQAEGENRSNEEAAQRYLDHLLGAQDTAPAAFLPAFLELAALEGDRHSAVRVRKIAMHCFLIQKLYTTLVDISY
jgi:hypothetical protein